MKETSLISVVCSWPCSAFPRNSAPRLGSWAVTDPCGSPDFSLQAKDDRFLPWHLPPITSSPGCLLLNILYSCLQRHLLMENKANCIKTKKTDGQAHVWEDLAKESSNSNYTLKYPGPGVLHISHSFWDFPWHWGHCKGWYHGPTVE